MMCRALKNPDFKSYKFYPFKQELLSVHKEDNTTSSRNFIHFTNTIADEANLALKVKNYMLKNLTTEVKKLKKCKNKMQKMTRVKTDF